MLSMEYRGVHRTVWSPHGAQFGEEFGEESSSDRAIGKPSLNTWSWTERNPKITSAPAFLPGGFSTLLLRLSFVTSPLGGATNEVLEKAI
jgi:hypothetical protein